MDSLTNIEVELIENKCKFLKFQFYASTVQTTGGKHKACGPNPALRLIFSSLAPCFCPQLHLISPKITSGPLKATARLMWPPVKMSLIPLVQTILNIFYGLQHFFIEARHMKYSPFEYYYSINIHVYITLHTYLHLVFIFKYLVLYVFWHSKKQSGGVEL